MSNLEPLETDKELDRFVLWYLGAQALGSIPAASFDVDDALRMMHTR